ncbi:hypothetical protein D3C81_1150290 [compost metagenome]
MFDIVCTQFEIENVDVFDDPLFSHRFWNYNDFTLNKPAQHDLGDGLVVFFCDRGQHFVAEHIAQSFSERRPRLVLHSLLFHKSGVLSLLVERVRFDLVDGGHDFVMHDEVHQTVGQEVADTDRLDLTFAV